MTGALLGAALWYAEQGLRVFPLSPRSKIPFKHSNGCHDASGNPDVIEGWWDSEPESNVGLATGYGIDVLDIDPPLGQMSRAKYWEMTFAKFDTDQLGKVLTPRPGGMHIYVPATGDGNRASIAPGIDYRGLGGYVVAPPSVLDPYPGCPDGGTYRFLGTPRM